MVLLSQVTLNGIAGTGPAQSNGRAKYGPEGIKKLKAFFLLAKVAAKGAATAKAAKKRAAATKASKEEAAATAKAAKAAEEGAAAAKAAEEGAAAAKAAEEGAAAAKVVEEEVAAAQAEEGEVAATQAKGEEGEQAVGFNVSFGFDVYVPVKQWRPKLPGSWVEPTPDHREAQEQAAAELEAKMAEAASKQLTTEHENSKRPS